MTSVAKLADDGDAKNEAAALRRNVEIKRRLKSFDRAAAIARELVGGEPAILQQTDTYFMVSHGRLKLRETPGGVAELIWYDRADQFDARTSRYQLIPIPDGNAIRRALAAALGVRCVVNKVRWLFLRANVRIHLDRVDRLGDFLEFEAVLPPEMSEATGAAQVAELLQSFELSLGDPVRQSYSELLLALD